jgi:hypothetical protein
MGAFWRYVFRRSAAKSVLVVRPIKQFSFSGPTGAVLMSEPTSHFYLLAILDLCTGQQSFVRNAPMTLGTNRKAHLPLEKLGIPPVSALTAKYKSTSTMARMASAY